MTRNIIIGNAICFMGSVIMAAMGLIKDKKKFLIAQSGMNVFFIVGNLFLNGITGAIANACTMARNIVCLKWNLNTPLKILFISLQIVLTIIARPASMLMWLPIFGTCIFTWFLDTENAVLLRILIIVTQMMWLVYDIHIINYATVPFDVAACITNSFALAGIVKKQHSEDTDDKEDA